MRDIGNTAICEIFTLIEETKDKSWSWTLLSKRRDIDPDKILQTMNIYPWDMNSFSSHPHLRIEHVLEHLLLLWNWYELSKHPNIHWSDILRHTDLPWDVNGLSANPNLDISVIRANPKIKWNWGEVTMNSGISLNHIIQHPSVPWNYNIVSFNPSIQPTQCLYVRKSKVKIRWDILSMSKNLNPKFIVQNRDLEWDFKLMSRNPVLEFDIILQLIKFFKNLSFWDWKQLTKHPQITLTNILQHKHLPWELDELNNNPTISWNDVLSHPDISWDYEKLSSHIIITFHDLFLNRHLNWDWTQLSQNENLYCLKEQEILSCQSKPFFDYIVTEMITEIPNIKNSHFSSLQCSFIQQDLLKHPYSICEHWREHLRWIDDFCCMFLRARFFWMCRIYVPSYLIPFLQEQYFEDSLMKKIKDMKSIDFEVEKESILLTANRINNVNPLMVKYPRKFYNFLGHGFNYEKKEREEVICQPKRKDVYVSYLDMVRICGSIVSLIQTIIL